MVGLAAEHKGAWVIIDLGITLGRREKVHILQQLISNWPIKCNYYYRNTHYSLTKDTTVANKP